MTRYFMDCEFIEDGITIELISIGIIAEDGREYYAQDLGCDLSRASQWVKDHVLVHLDEQSWKVRSQIRRDLLRFMDIEKHGEPEIWTYYGCYDYVALCQLYGPMIDLPKGWPMHTMDIKQWAKMLGNPKLPEQGKGEHNALADARWNKLAYDFLEGYAQQQLSQLLVEHLYYRSNSHE